MQFDFRLQKKRYIEENWLQRARTTAASGPYITPSSLCTARALPCLTCLLGGRQELLPYCGPIAALRRLHTCVPCSGTRAPSSYRPQRSCAQRRQRGRGGLGAPHTHTHDQRTYTALCGVTVASCSVSRVRCVLDSYNIAFGGAAWA